MEKSSGAKQKKSKYQKYENIRIHRSELKDAPYNPRSIDKKSQDRLRHVVKRIGLVEPLVWNKRTGHIVGGHQRIKILDTLEKTDDYFIDVACVDMDETQEIEANIALNNPSIQGEYDIEMLSSLQHEHNLDFKTIGFTDSDIDLMFEGELTQFLDDTEDVRVAKDKLREIKETRKNGAGTFDEKQSGEFYFIVVCESNPDKEELLRMFKVPPFEMYVAGYKLREVIDKTGG